MDYTVIQSNTEIKACARQQLQGVWGEMAFTFFVYFLMYLPANIITVLDSSREYFPEIPSFFGLNFLLSIAVFLVNGPFALGFAGYFMRRVRGEEIHLSIIFEGFNRFFRSFLLMFLTSLLTALWSLLLLVPGIVKALAYSMAFYIMRDNPDIEPLDAIDKSQVMMRGYKGKLLLLELSFIGWALLGLLTLGIGYLWLYPYISLSLANFYENLKQSQEKAATAAAAAAAPAAPAAPV
jgi:uncharacterized membrane protein